MAIKYIVVLFVETPRKFITAKLSIRKPGSSSVLIICDLFNLFANFYLFAVINLRGVSTNKTTIMLNDVEQGSVLDEHFNPVSASDFPLMCKIVWR
jgi:hypothetical protein